MFSYLNGTVSHKTDRFAVVDVGGVGFKVFLTTRNLQKLEVGEPKKVFTYLRVAEDILDLYGFLDAEELEMFELLISVNGIGAKAAMSILSTLPANELAIAIVTGDAKAVSKAQGVGGKTAQRLILELKDKIKNESLVAGPADFDMPVITGTMDEAIGALVVLGYSLPEAQKAVSAAYSDELSAEDLIKQALKKMMK